MTEPTLHTALPTLARTATPPPALALAGRLLGEILVHTAGLAPDKLEEALASQRGEHAGVRLGEILVRMKALAEEDVLRALAAQLELPFLGRVDAEETSAGLAGPPPFTSS